MKFCELCGTYMKKTEKGLFCPKCGHLIPMPAELREVKKIKPSGSVHVVDPLQRGHLKVSRVCPECGNTEAFHWFSTISGDHAGISRERTLEHFKCTKCAHTRTLSS